MEHWIYTTQLFGHGVSFNMDTILNGVSFNMDTILTMWFSMLLLIILAIVTTRKLEIVPGKLQLVGESIIKYFNDISKASMGNDEAQKHIAIILTLFMFILTANLVGQLPLKLIHLAHGELASPNNDINMTAAMAIVVSIYYIFYGVKKSGFKFFFKGFSIDGIIITLVDTLELFVRPAAMAIVVSIYYIFYGVKKSGFKFFFKGFSIDGIIITLVDTLELFVRPFSLALRLFANILAGELLVATFIGLCSVAVPLPFMLFELFVALIQALVFTLLSTTYISMAVQEEH